jgi:SAM-dependent methyltransferase
VNPAPQSAVGTSVNMLETLSAAESVLAKLKAPFLDWLIPAAALKSVIYRSRSPLVKAQREGPGGWRAMELVYQNAAPVDWIDRMALTGNAYARAARNRRKVVIQLLTKLVDDIPARSEQDPIVILNLGAGTGTHVRSVLTDLARKGREVRGILLDRNAEGLAQARQLAAEAGLTQSIQCLQGDAREFERLCPGVKPDIIEIIGLIEYLSDHELAVMFQHAAALLRPGGAVIVNAMRDTHGGARLFERVFRLRMTMRDTATMSTALGAAGFRVTETVTEPVQIHTLIVARTSG